MHNCCFLDGSTISSYSDAGKPITKNAFKKLQKDKEKAERKAATAAKIAAEKAERDANQVVSFYF